jgi:hypothetical protein
MTATLCRLGRFQEAEALVPEVRRLAERPGGGAIDLRKTRWLEANLAAGLDATLLYREENRFAEIKTLADEMLAIFKAQNVHRSKSSGNIAR